jgi:molecular chaperone DnaK
MIGAPMVDYSNIPRDSRRVPLETRVQFKFDRFSGFLSDFSANVSPGGMFIRTRTPQPEGTVLEFEFRLGDGFELIRGRGEVVWTRAQDEGPARPAGMGLRFLELSQGSKELIYRIVDHHIQQGGTPFDVTQGPPDPIPPPPLSPTAPVLASAAALSPLNLELPPLPGTPVSPSSPGPPKSQAPVAPPLAPPAGGWEPESSKLWPQSPEEEPGGFDPSPYAPPLAPPDDWMKARQALPKEAFSELAASAPEPVSAPSHPAAGLLFGTHLERETPHRSRRALPWVLVGVLVVLAAAAWLFRDTLLGFAGLGGDDEVVQAPAPEARPHRNRLPALPAAPPAPAATAGATPAATSAAARPLGSAATSAGPMTEVSPVRPATTPAKPAPTPASVAAAVVPASPRAGSKPQLEKPAPVPAIREDTGPAATGVDKITFEKAFGGTDIILWGNGAIRARTYVRSRIEGNPPRELIRISGMKRSAPAARLAVGTPEVLQVRTGLHAGDELHIVLDLAGPRVTVTGVEEGENRLRIHLKKQ